MFKKLLAILLACLMIPCGLALAEAEVLTCENFEYTLNGDGSATIVRCTDEVGTTAIPAELDGHPVTAIEDSAFSYCESLTNVVIPDGVTHLGESAFFRCPNLSSVTLPDSLSSIGANPFEYCTQLSQITVSPDHPALATIDGVLFEKATRTLVCYPCARSAESYSVPQGIQTIGEYAFTGCSFQSYTTSSDNATSAPDAVFFDDPSPSTPLRSIVLPDSVTTIGNCAFFDCPSLTSITIPDSVTSIGDSAFGSCGSLTSITLPDGITSIGDSAFAVCKSLTSVTLPDGITSIGDSAFADCKSLTSVAIPDGITSIGKWAFSYCDSLTSVTIPDSVTFMGEEVFDACPNLTLTVSQSSYAETYAVENNIPYTC